MFVIECPSACWVVGILEPLYQTAPQDRGHEALPVLPLGQSRAELSEVYPPFLKVLQITEEERLRGRQLPAAGSVTPALSPSRCLQILPVSSGVIPGQYNAQQWLRCPGHSACETRPSIPLS